MIPLFTYRNFSIGSRTSIMVNSRFRRSPDPRDDTLFPCAIEAQMLDAMDIEREAGITIKAQTVRINYTPKNRGISPHLIDTPGSRRFCLRGFASIARVEGIVAGVDSTQGVRRNASQTFYMRLTADHDIVPDFFN